MGAGSHGLRVERWCRNFVVLWYGGIVVSYRKMDSCGVAVWLALPVSPADLLLELNGHLHPRHVPVTARLDLTVPGLHLVRSTQLSLSLQHSDDGALGEGGRGEGGRGEGGRAGGGRDGGRRRRSGRFLVGLVSARALARSRSRVLALATGPALDRLVVL